MNLKLAEYIGKIILIGAVAVSATLVCLDTYAYDIAIIYSEGVTQPESGSEVIVATEPTFTGCEETTADINKSQQITSNSNKHEYSGIHISDSEMEELRRVVAAESQTQSLAGRKAVVEVIFNRVLSSKWPNTVHGVLSQKGQFATYKMRYAKWVEPSYADKAIEAVLTNGRTVLPSTRYVFFDTKGINGKDHIKIGAHYFGR